MRRKPTLPTTQSSLTYHKPLAKMTPAEGHEWFKSLHKRLVQKMQRERAYLDRRASRGTNTPTDEAYRADQVLEQELLSLLDQLIALEKEEEKNA